MTIDKDELIEQAAGPFRETGPDGRVQSSPAWHDLDEEGRKEAYERALVDRKLQKAADPRGLSATTRAILRKIRGG